MALWRWDGIRWPLKFFFHPVVCSSAIYLLRNRWCQFQILNSLGWMNLPDEMLFLNPAPYLPAFFVNTECYQVGRQSTGTRESSWWRQLWWGCDCFRGGDTGQESGFGLNHYKVRGLAVPCSLTAMHFLSTQRGLGDGWKVDTIWEALFSHPLSTTVILIRGKWSVTCDITQSHYNDS